ncbi:hypothetical protein ABK040_006134 [Willaertia magna]
MSETLGSALIKQDDGVWLTIYDPQSGKNYYHNKITNETTWVLPNQSSPNLMAHILPEEDEESQQQQQLNINNNNKASNNKTNVKSSKQQQQHKRSSSHDHTSSTSSTPATPTNNKNTNFLLLNHNNNHKNNELKEEEEENDESQWEKAIDVNSGRHYYYNKITKESRWEKPISRKRHGNNQLNNNKQEEEEEGLLSSSPTTPQNNKSRSQTTFVPANNRGVNYGIQPLGESLSKLLVAKMNQQQQQQQHSTTSSTSTTINNSSSSSTSSLGNNSTSSSNNNEEEEEDNNNLENRERSDAVWKAPTTTNTHQQQQAFLTPQPKSLQHPFKNTSFDNNNQHHHTPIILLKESNHNNNHHNNHNIGINIIPSSSNNNATTTTINTNNLTINNNLTTTNITTNNLRRNTFNEFSTNEEDEVLEGSQENHEKLPKICTGDHSLIKYGKNNFQKFTKGIFKKEVKVEKLLEFQKDRLQQTLHLIKHQQYNEKALRCFELIQLFMKDRSFDKCSPTVKQLVKSEKISDFELAKEILQIALLNVPIRNEITIYCCKQTNNHSKTENLLKGIQLLCLILSAFPPTTYDLQESVLHYIQQYLMVVKDQKVKQFAELAEKQLRRTVITGPRKTLPSDTEIKNMNNPNPPEPVFGVSISEYLRWQKEKFPKVENSKPYILVVLAEQLKKLEFCNVEGIFRLPGDTNKVESIKEILSKGIFDISNSTIKDPHVFASVFKLWLRELAEPLIPHRLYDTCINNSTNEDQCMKILAELPGGNRAILVFVIDFLAQMLPYSKKTMMTSENLAVVFCPNILRSQSTDPMTVMRNAASEKQFVKNLIDIFGRDYMN